MFNLKKIMLAAMIACSMVSITTYSTVSVAGEKARTNKEVVVDVVKSLNEALDSINNKETKEVTLAHIQSARQFSKEIFVGSLGAIVDRGADAIVSSRRNVKNDDMDAARESLQLAIEEYTEMGRKTL